ncbi:MAG: biotin/lipoyl-containing protein [Roseovarius sp.]
MKVSVKVPKVGLTVEEATVAEWLKSVGDRVEHEETIASVEADKATYEIPAPAAGVLEEIRVESGETVEVGSVIAVIRT